jgi:hypothetical protein
VLLVLCVLCGAYLRTRGMFGSPLPFWEDEAAWASRTLRFALVEQLIRPIGFMAASKTLAKAFGATELAFRLLPWAASLAGLVLAVKLARVFVPSRAGRLLLVAVLAFHPDAIDLAKEFKPYALSLTLHIGLLLSAITYVRVGSSLWLGRSLGLAVLGVFFAQDAVFAYPGLYLTLGVVALRARRLPHAGAVALTAVLNGAIVLAMYWFMWRHIAAGNQEETFYWGRKYDVFYVPNETTGTRLAWFLQKYVGFMEFPAARHDYWSIQELFDTRLIDRWKSLENGVWILLHIFGILGLVFRKRWVEIVLLAAPLLALAAFNWLGYWPFGVFRTNLFALAYVTLMAASAFSLPAFSRPWLAFAPVGLLVIVPLLTFERTWHSRKVSWFTYQSYFPQSLELLTKLAPPGEHPETVVFDGMGCSCWGYYARHQRAREVIQEMKRRFVTRCVRQQGALVARAVELLEEERRVWIVTNDDRQVAPVLEGIPPGYQITHKAIIPPSALVVSIERAPRKRRR